MFLASIIHDSSKGASHTRTLGDITPLRFTSLAEGKFTSKWYLGEDLLLLHCAAAHDTQPGVFIA